jgi:hypothetical protein
MTWTWEVASPPDWYRRFDWKSAGRKRNGVHYVGDTVTFHLGQANGGYTPTAIPIDYTIRNYFGKVVSSGVFWENDTSFTPTAPGGGWKPGWYRVYLSGPQSDTNFYHSYGASNFCVVKDDPHFVTMPDGPTVGGYHSDSPDYVMKGVMGLGTSRLVINNLDDPTADIATALQDLALTKTYWTATGTPDTERVSREPWCTFPLCDGSPEQLANVTAVVDALYPDCKYYEGPSNEPSMNSATATAMQAFQAAVHAGNAGAKAIGPCPVSMHPTLNWAGFFDADGGDYCDEISFHAYNAATNGDLNLGRYTIESTMALLDSYGLSAKQLWQTESVHAGIIPYGIFHPRRARKAMLEWMLFEQNGVPRERNNWWYDQSHGFWDYPAWLEDGDGALLPAAVLGRVMAEETWGKPYDSALDFGDLGNAMYLGNVYEGSGGVCVAVMATSYIAGGSVTLAVSGDPGPFTVVDGFGVERTMALSRGRITIPMTDVPAYVRLPVGASASVYAINGHSPLGIGASLSPSATTKQIDGVTQSTMADGAYMTNFGLQTGVAPTGIQAEVPGDSTLLWSTSQTVDRVMAWFEVWSVHGTPTDFDVQTFDGADWTTQVTVTKPPPWFDFGTDAYGPGCFQETFWDEQWVFDLELPTPVSCLGVRLNVRAGSYGGEPLAGSAIANGAGGGQGADIQEYRVQEIAVVDSNRYAGVA